jgi:hypothetical protein
MKRRNFLLDFLRYGLLGGLFSIGGFLFLNRKVTPTENCTLSPLCEQCKKYRACDKLTNQKTTKNG